MARRTDERASLLPILAWLLHLGCSSTDGATASTSRDAATGTDGATGGDAATGPEGFPIPPAPAPLSWAPCTESYFPNTECATLEVPLDYEHPDGETITIALSRVQAADPGRRIGVVLLNPGGPGIGGRGMAPEIRDNTANPTFQLSGPMTPEVVARFDLIGFDPRGVGASVPALNCGVMPAVRTVDFSPDDAAEQQALVQAMGDVAADCEAKHGPLLQFMDSYSVARDMDQIRRALGEEKINYFGASYGTVIGTAYAALFPDRVRAMALDGAVRPNVDGPAYMRETAKNWERAFDEYTAACDADPTCAARFPGGMKATYDRAVTRVSTKPLVDPQSGDTMNESDLAIVIAGAGLQTLGRRPGSIPAIDSFIEAAARGDGTGVSVNLNLIQFGVTMSDPFHCADMDTPDPDVVYRDLLPQMIAESPRFGHVEGPWILPCAHWPISPRKHAPPRAHGAPPILVVGGTGDGVLPYQWSVDLASALESGVLLTRDGVGHVAFSQCVVDAESAYLVDLAVPAAGTVCPQP